MNIANKPLTPREKILDQETKLLADGEPNYFKALTSNSFIWKLVFVVVLLLISVLICLNVTLDNSVDSWYYNLYKPDWAPDGITIIIIYCFLSALFLWAWYVVSEKQRNWFVDLAFVIFYTLYTLWFILFYKLHNIETGRILIDIITAINALLFLYVLFYVKVGTASVYLFMFLIWSIILIVYSYKVQDLTKEYRILGLAKDINSSLYKKKMRLEIVDGIRVTETGEKIEFNPEEQE